MSKWKLVPVEATDQMIDAALDAKIGGKVLSCAEIYCAMLDAAPVPAADDCESVCDAYAAENQQFSDELARLRAENEALQYRFDAVCDECSEYARANAHLGIERDDLRAENERLKATLKPVTRDEINEAVIEVMAQAQSFASSWSLVGGRYDPGDMLDHAHKQKSELERMVRAAIDAAIAQGKV